MLKKVWITKITDGIFSLSLENNGSHERVNTRELLFPENPTPEHPLRSVLNIGILNQDDINLIAEILDKYRSC